MATRATLAILYCSPGELTLVWAAPFVKTGYRYSFCVFSVLSEISESIYEVVEIHDGITAFNLCPAMDQGFRCLKCVPRGSTVRHWSSTPHNNDGTALEWPRGVSDKVGAILDWDLIPSTCISYITSSILNEHWVADLHRSQVSRQATTFRSDPAHQDKARLLYMTSCFYLIGTLGLDCLHWTALPVPLLHQMPLCISHPVLIQVLLEHASETSKPARKRG